MVIESLLGCRAAAIAGCADSSRARRAAFLCPGQDDLHLRLLVAPPLCARASFRTLVAAC